MFRNKKFSAITYLSLKLLQMAVVHKGIIQTSRMFSPNSTFPNTEICFSEVQ